MTTLNKILITLPSDKNVSEEEAPREVFMSKHNAIITSILGWRHDWLWRI